MPTDIERAVEEVLAAVDARLQPQVRRDFEAARAKPISLNEDVPWVVAGHRAAGKSTLLPLLGALTPRPTFDLDAELERRHRRAIRGWYAGAPGEFRAAEREVFASLPMNALVAVGGGFLSCHADLLERAEVILVPVTFETYRERLLGDTGRPRLHPELSLDDEIRQSFEARERAHAQARTIPLAQALAALAVRSSA